MSRTRHTADLVSLNALNAISGKVGIGTTARSNQLYVEGNTQIVGVLTATGSLNVTGIATVSSAFYMPQYTTNARDSGSFNEGAIIYNSTTKKLEYYNGTNWVSLPGVTIGLALALDG